MSTIGASKASLEESYEKCIQIAKDKAKHFHWAFQKLGGDRYRGICALYAIARLADDISDDEEDPEKALANSTALRKQFDRAIGGEDFPGTIFPAVVDTHKKFEIDPKWVHLLIDGTEMDASKKIYDTWDETYKYCYHVASVIGIMTIHVFGFDKDAKVNGMDAYELAERTGIAFQLTNILRDIKEDAERERIYLAKADYEKFGLSEADFLQAKDSPQMRDFIKTQVDRAKDYYQAGPALLKIIESKQALTTIVNVYSALLDKMEQKKYDVLTQRVSLSTFEKVKLAGKALIFS